MVTWLLQKGIKAHQKCSANISTSQVIRAGIVAQHLAQRGTCLAEEMQSFSFYGRVCAMKGLLQALPQEILCSTLHLLPTDATPSSHASAHLCAVQQSQGKGSGSSTLSTSSLDGTHTAGRIPAYPEAQNAGEMNGSGALHTPWTDSDPASRADAAVQDSSTSDKRPGSSKSEVQNTRKSVGIAEAAIQSTAATAGSADSAGTADSAGSAGTAGSADSAGTAGKRWLLLSDCALPACCAAVQQSTDAHHKFHAMSALAYCLARVKQCLQVSSVGI